MANKKISELTEAVDAIAPTDEFVFVDKSDTTGSASGTTKRVTALEMPGPKVTGHSIYGRSDGVEDTGESLAVTNNSVLARSGTSGLASIQLDANELLGRTTSGNLNAWAPHDFSFQNSTANGGNPRLRPAPEATAHVDAQGVNTTNYDITLSSDGYYMFTVVAFVVRSGAYCRVGATIDATRASGTLSIEGSQVDLSGGDGTGLTLTLSATSGNLRCALANASGTINGHINVGWILTDLPS